MSSVLLAAPAERFRLDRLLREARVAAEWIPVPLADEIRAKDEERLLGDVAALAGEATEEELAIARRLLEDRAPLLVAAALVRRERSRRPAPEELPGSAQAAREAPVRRAERDGKKARRGPKEEGVWFRLTIGREKNADPRWILPLLCRRGEVTREEIGKIVVLPKETKFEIAKSAVARFSKASRRPDPKMPAARIERVKG